MQNLKPILLVEDDRVDMMTFKRTLKDLGIKNEVVHTVNGEEALQYLKNDDKEEPCYVFLDLNMPKMNGIEFLKIAKADKVFGVAGYMVKPADYKEFVEAIRTVNLYWNLSRLPSKGPENERYQIQNLAD
jgi:DNA-binding response OmpR family regulator